MEITNGKVHDKSAEFAHKNPENKKIRHRALSQDKKGARQCSLLDQTSLHPISYFHSVPCVQMTKFISFESEYLHNTCVPR
jgi:hypothetical protein